MVERQDEVQRTVDYCIYRQKRDAASRPRLTADSASGRSFNDASWMRREASSKTSLIRERKSHSVSRPARFIIAGQQLPANRLLLALTHACFLCSQYILAMLRGRHSLMTDWRSSYVNDAQYITIY